MAQRDDQPPAGSGSVAAGDPVPGDAPVPAEGAGGRVPESGRRESERVFWGPRDNRFRVESLLVRLVSTLGIVGIGVLLGAILVSQDVEGWIVGLVISATSVILAAILWSSRRL